VRCASFVKKIKYHNDENHKTENEIMTWHGTAKGSCNIYLPDCLSTPIRDPWEKDYAAIVPRFSGGLSAISSATIIYVILRSEKGLSGTYHRIMFGMSTADILGSTAMALTSLPMPSYMLKETEFGYHWAGTRLGNTYTCNAQGFFASFGASTMFFYNASLCIFYACSIAFNMRERNIRKYVEPFIHGLPLLVGLSYAVPPLFLEMYNPGITSYAWCAPLPYPDECVYQDVECIRGSPKAMNFIMTFLRCLILSDFSIIFICLLLTVWKVISTERLLRDLTVNMYRMNHGSNLARVLRRHRFTKSVALQALAYIIAFLASLLLPLLRAMNVVSGEDESDIQWENIARIDRAILVLLPLQGFYNLIIFVSHKIINYRRTNSSVSICGVLRLLFLQSGTHEPVYISRISIVRKEHDHNDNECFCDDDNGKDIKENHQIFVNNGNRLHTPRRSSMRGFYQFDVVDDDNEAEAFRFRIGLFQQNQLQDAQHSSVECDTDDKDSVTQLRRVKKEDSTWDNSSNKELHIPVYSPQSSGNKISRSSSNGADHGDRDISYYDDMSYLTGEISCISYGDAEEEPRRRKYYVSNI
jgi:hypothetical protein